MTPSAGYSSPRDFRRALTDRLKTLAGRGPWSLAQLQRQIAYDRLLERLYLVDDSWILKGAAALLAREIGVRATVDLDVYRASSRDTAQADVRRAATLDIGDRFRFEVGRAQQLTEVAATRLPVTTYIGPTVWQAFRIDLVGPDLRMTGQPENVPPLARVLMPNFEQHGYRAYPLVDHLADKLAATYQRYGSGEQPSTRYRDLVDLVAIVTGAAVDADAQMRAIRSEFARRALSIPAAFDVPDRSLWELRYEAEARRSLVPERARILDGALDIVRAFLDPLFNGVAAGHWEPENASWSG